MPTRQDLLPYEQLIQTFLARAGTDLDAQAAVFNLDHAAMDVIATMESLALRPHELTHAGFVVLMTIWISGPRETRELAAVLRVTRGAIVGSVNTLEKKGLVRRRRSKIDRRLVTVELTDAQDLVPYAAVKVLREGHPTKLSLTLEEQRTLASLCRKMGAGARAMRRDRNGHIEPLNPALFLSKATKMPNKLTPARPRR